MRRVMPIVLSSAAAALAGCELTLRESVSLSIDDPTYLLMGFGLVAGMVAVTSLVFAQRGLWWSVIDGVCIAGVIALALSPIYFAMTRSIFASAIVGTLGLTSLIGPVIVYRYAKGRPIEDLFRHNQDDDF